MYRVVFDPFKPNVGDFFFHYRRQTGRTSMGTSRSTFLHGCRSHWVRIHSRLVLLMLSTLVTVLLGFYTRVYRFM